MYSIRNTAVLMTVGLVLGACDRVVTDPIADPGPTASLTGGDVFGVGDIATLQVGDPCGMPGADANGNLIFGGLGEITSVTAARGVASMTCEGTGLTNLSGASQTFTGFLCNVIRPDGSVVLTDDTEAGVSAAGVGRMVCRSPF